MMQNMVRDSVNYNTMHVLVIGVLYLFKRCYKHGEDLGNIQWMHILV